MSHRRRPAALAALAALAAPLGAIIASFVVAMLPCTLAAQRARPVAAIRRAIDGYAGAGGLAVHAAPTGLHRDTATTRGPSGTERFGMELLGGSLGSALGLMGAIAAQDPDDCVEDTGCALASASAMALASTAGATIGTMVIGRSANTEPEPIGAALGAVVGVAGGLVALVLVDQAGGSDRRLRGAMAYVAGQALMTAAGSRIGAAIRDQGR